MDPEGGTESYPDDSIYSGLTVDEFPHAEERAEALAERAARDGRQEARWSAPTTSTSCWPRAGTRPSTTARVGCSSSSTTATGSWRSAWHGEPTPALPGRPRPDATFPEIARAVRGLPLEGLVLDGEVVVHDAEGLPSFSRLQKRGRILNKADALRAERGAARRLLRLRPPGAGGLRPAQAAPPGAEGAPAGGPPHRGAHPLLGPHPGAGRGHVRPGGRRCGWRGSWARRPTRPTRAAAPATG